MVGEVFRQVGWSVFDLFVIGDERGVPAALGVFHLHAQNLGKDTFELVGKIESVNYLDLACCGHKHIVTLNVSVFDLDRLKGAASKRCCHGGEDGSAHIVSLKAGHMLCDDLGLIGNFASYDFIFFLRFFFIFFSHCFLDFN